jgi:hypothetical protein
MYRSVSPLQSGRSHHEPQIGVGSLLSMLAKVAPIGLLLALPLVACGKEEPQDTAPRASASASASAAVPSTPPAPPPSAGPSASAPSVPPPKCPAGLTGNAVPPYCIKLPTGYTVKQARTTAKRGSIDYDTGTTTDVLTVSYDDTAMAGLAKDVEGEMKFGGDKLEKKGDLPGGNKWFQGTHAEYSHIVTLIKGTGMTFKCSFAYQPKKPPPAGAVDACKSLVLP